MKKIVVFLAVFMFFGSNAFASDLPKNKTELRVSSSGVYLISDISRKKNQVFIFVNVTNNSIVVRKCDSHQGYCVFFVEENISSKVRTIYGFKSLQEAKNWVYKGLKLR